MNEIKEVEFNGDRLVAVRTEDLRIWVPMRRVCEAIGLTWGSQHQKLQGAEWTEGISMIETPQNRDGGRQTELCLNVEFLPMYLAQIQINRTKPEIREKILRYKTEARRVLADAFLRGQRPEPTQSNDPYADHPAVVATRKWLEAEDRFKRIETENRMMATKQAVADAQLAVQAKNLERVVTHRKGGDPVPAGTISLQMIRAKYFKGVNNAITAEYLHEINHPKHPFTQVNEHGVEQTGFCYEERGLQEMALRFAAECEFIKETPMKLNCRHPLVSNNFGFIKDQISHEVRLILERKRTGQLNIDDHRETLEMN